MSAEEEEEEEATDGFPEFPPRSLFSKHFRSLTPGKYSYVGTTKKWLFKYIFLAWALEWTLS